MPARTHRLPGLAHSSNIAACDKGYMKRSSAAFKTFGKLIGKIVHLVAQPQALRDALGGGVGLLGQGLVGQPGVGLPKSVSQRWNSSALRSGSATCLGMGVPEKRAVRRRMDDQKSTSFCRCASHSSMWLSKMGPRTGSLRTSA